MTIVAVISTPEKNGNTEDVVNKIAESAKANGQDVKTFHLNPMTNRKGCQACFACKAKGRCVQNDDLTPVLDAIREADGVIIGTPNYLGGVSAGLYALIERLVFQNLTYQTDPRWYHAPATPTLFIMTSNAPDGAYQKGGFYADMLQSKLLVLTNAIGPTRPFVCGSTLQVTDYSHYNWTMFDGEQRHRRHEKVFPLQREQVAEMGAELVTDPWK